jgi:hypothetical protein
MFSRQMSWQRVGLLMSFDRTTSRLAACVPFGVLLFACHSPDGSMGPGAVEGPGVQRVGPSQEELLALLTPQAIFEPSGGTWSTLVISRSILIEALGVAGTVTGPTRFGREPSSAHGINSSGQLVYNEVSVESPDPSTAYRRDPNGGTRLRAITQSGEAVALDINDAGIAAGSIREFDEATGYGPALAAIWSTDGTPALLPVAPGGASQGAAGINESGVVVGAAAGRPFSRRAIRWDATGAHVLPSGTADSSAAFDVNDAGTAVGWISEGINLVAVTWSPGSILSRLTLPDGAAGGTAAGINNLGQVVGQAVYKDGSGTVTRSEAVLWSPGGVPTVLPGLRFGMAVKINEAGVAAGWTSEARFEASHGPVIWAGGQRTPVPLGDGEGSTLPGQAFVNDLNANLLSGMANPDGQDNHARAALWSFTVTGVCTAVAITSQPQNQTVLLGRPVTLAVTASGTAPLTYQWRKNGTAIPGATTATYQIASARLAHAGNYTVVVTNGCGSVTSSVARVAVHFNFRGFFQPTRNPGETAPYVVNRVVAGSAVLIKFSLSGNQGLNVLAAGNPRSKPVACTLADNTGGQPTKSIGGGLAYDRGADQYRYIWKTEKAWAGTCRQLMVGLSDGTVHTALFRFK